jgi:hypothetical protein
VSDSLSNLSAAIAGNRCRSAGDATPARCRRFDGFMRTRDAEFLSSYRELGVASRRIMAETCLRALVMAVRRIARCWR